MAHDLGAHNVAPLGIRKFDDQPPPFLANKPQCDLTACVCPLGSDTPAGIAATNAAAAFTTLSLSSSSSSSTGVANSTDDDSIPTEVTNAKFIMMPLVFLLTLGASGLPWLLRRFTYAIQIMSIACCFSAGVILGGGFNHLLPEALEAFEEYNEVAQLREYPYVMVILVATLLLLILADAVLVRGGLDGKPVHGHSHGEPGEHGGHGHMVPQLPEHVQQAEHHAHAHSHGHGGHGGHGGNHHGHSHGGGEGNGHNVSPAIAAGVLREEVITVKAEAKENRT